MNKIELVQKIGNEVCEGCGPDTDCGIDLNDCTRIKNALKLLDDFLSNKGSEADTKQCGLPAALLTLKQALEK